MRTLAIVALLAAGTALLPLEAQHSGATSGCNLCHSTHRPANAYLLIAGEPGPTLSPALNAVSRSCLRCHLTPTLRSQQPEFDEESLLPLVPGRYLGLDLSGGHPLGTDAAAGLPLPSGAWRDPRLGVGRPLASGSELGCTSCHDPHSRAGPLRDAEEMQAICTQCHEAGRYERRGHTTIPCVQCHALHDAGGDVALLRGANTETICRACHDPGVTTLASKAAAPVHARDQKCSACHAVHG